MAAEKIEIHVMRCGSVLVDEALPFRDRSKSPIAYTGLFRAKRHQVCLPVFAYLIRHPKGNILVDTGWDMMVREYPQKALGFLVSLASKPNLPRGESVSEQLIEKAIPPSSLDYVVLTHLDADHAGGLCSVKEAKRIIVDADELGASKQGIRYNRKQLSRVHIQAYRHQESPYGPFHRSYDLFGDDSVILVSLPGHSAGMTGVLIQNNGRFVLLTGDCAYAESSWKQMRLPGIIAVKHKMATSLEWVKMMSQQDGCVRVFASHDPEVEPQVIEI